MVWSTCRISASLIPSSTPFERAAISRSFTAVRIRRRVDTATWFFSFIDVLSVAVSRSLSMDLILAVERRRTLT